jgi:hypothetical protein
MRDRWIGGVCLDRARVIYLEARRSHVSAMIESCENPRYRNAMRIPRLVTQPVRAEAVWQDARLGVYKLGSGRSLSHSRASRSNAG